jgi:hypothetical protein
MPEVNPAEQATPLSLWHKIAIGTTITLCLVSFIFRLTTIPRDFGGTFAEVWLLLVGLGGSSALLMQFPARRKDLFPLCLIVVCTLCYATLLYSPQCFMPPVIACFMGIGFTAMFLEDPKKRLYLPFVIIGFALFFTFMLYVALNGIRTINEMRTIRSDEVSEIEIRPTTDHEASGCDSTPLYTVTERPLIDKIVGALKYTFPYSPNHEGVSNRYLIRIRRPSHDDFCILAGKGNRVTRDTAFIGFYNEHDGGADPGNYQNKALYDALLTSLPMEKWKKGDSKEP